MSNANALSAVDPASVLTRILNNEPTLDIAKSLGVTRAGLSYWLLRNAEDVWHNVQIARALKRKEDAEQNLEDAANGLDLARAREILKSAQWDLERICRRIYGQDPPPGGAGVQINIGIGVRSVDGSGDKTLTIDVAGK